MGDVEANRKPKQVVVVVEGSRLPPGLLDCLAKHCETVEILPSSKKSDPLLMPVCEAVFVDKRMPRRGGKGRKSRWARDHRWH